MTRWQIFQNLNTSEIHHGLTPIPYTFVSCEGEYWKAYNPDLPDEELGPFNHPGNEYTEDALLKTPTTWGLGTLANNGAISRFYFQMEMPLITLGKIAMDIEMLGDPTKCASMEAGSILYGSIAAFINFPLGGSVDWNSVVGDQGDAHLGPTGSSQIYTDCHSAPRVFVQNYNRWGDARVSWIPSGDMTKSLIVEIVNQYRLEDIYYKIHGLYWKT